MTNATATRIDTAWRAFQKAAPVKLQTAQTLPMRQLRKDHRAELLGAIEFAHSAIALVAVNETLKCRPGQKIHQLGKQSLADVHERFSEEKLRKGAQIGILRSNLHHLKNHEKYRPLDYLHATISSSTGHW